MDTQIVIWIIVAWFTIFLLLGQAVAQLSLHFYLTPLTAVSTYPDYPV